MLSIFPELLVYQLFGITLIRITLGITLVYIGIITIDIKKTAYEIEFRTHDFPFAKFIPKSFGFMELICGAFIIVGFLTQIMAIISIYVFLNLLFLEKYVGRVFNYPNIMYFSFILISLSLLFLGPGAFAVDFTF